MKFDNKFILNQNRINQIKQRILEQVFRTKFDLFMSENVFVTYVAIESQFDIYNFDID